jgi:hypothetical protein
VLLALADIAAIHVEEGEDEEDPRAVSTDVLLPSLTHPTPSNQKPMAWTHMFATLGDSLPICSEFTVKCAMFFRDAIPQVR